jgi:predicted glycogen debranching enzyme
VIDRPSPASVLEQEWLVTNGTGSYASGTIAGVMTRRYHGLLVAALDPPLGRTVLVAKIDDALAAEGELAPISANRWQDPQAPLSPSELPSLRGFRLDGSVPVWSFGVGSNRVEKRVWMRDGSDTTYVRYTHAAGREPVHVLGKALVNYRDFHATTRGGDWQMDIAQVSSGVRVTAFDGAVPFRLLSADATVTPQRTWYRDYALRIEAYRGLEALDDHFYAAEITAVIEPSASVTLVATTDQWPDLDGSTQLTERIQRDRHLVEISAAPDDVTSRLVLAADQFIVRRAAEGTEGAEGAEGRSIVAGYHWFGDWGRDTMVALPGLTLATGRHDEASAILRTYARFVDQGMLPNRFPDSGGKPDYNTIDASLWYFEAVRAHHEATGDLELVAEVFPVLDDIIAWHQAGTRYGIHVDPVDGLLTGGEEGTQLTWMDAKIGEWVVTPRIGKAIEVNALWYNALRTAASLATLLHRDAGSFEAAADRTQRSFARFWNHERGYCFDVIDGPEGHEARLRPNQLLAIALPHSPLEREQQRAVVEACRRHLLTPLGLRTLGPDEPGYRGHYGGGPAERDGAYHQGTAWPWLIGPYASAHLRVHRDPEAIRSLLEPYLAHLAEYGIGSIAECADGDRPHPPRAAIAQAWSIAEVLRVWRRLSNMDPQPRRA